MKIPSDAFSLGARLLVWDLEFVIDIAVHHTSVTTILGVEDGEVDGVIHGKNFISNPDLIIRVRKGYPFAVPDRSTFYTHGPFGYISYPTYEEEQKLAAQKEGVTQEKELQLKSNAASGEAKANYSNGIGYSNEVPVNGDSEPKKRVAIIGAGVSGITSVNALQRLGGFELSVFERKSGPGGVWAYSDASTTVPKFPTPTVESIDPPHPRPKADLPATLPRSTQDRPGLWSPLYNSIVGNIPTFIMNGDTVFKVPAPWPETAPYNLGEEISAAIIDKAHEYDDIISYRTTVEDVTKIEDNKLRLLLRKQNEDETDYWYEEDFDFLLVAGGHNSVPKVPDWEGLGSWKGEKRHAVTYRKPEELKDKRVLIVGSSESAIDIVLQELPLAKQPIYVAQRTPHPRYPTVFAHDGVKVVPTIKKFTAESIILIDDTTLSLLDVDTVIFATGYFYSYPFLNNVRPHGDRLYVPGTYQHIFDIHNQNIAFNGLSNVALSWLTWERSAFVVALFWAGLIHLPKIEEQKRWEATRLKETTGRKSHAMNAPSERVIYFDELNELAGEYLSGHDVDDTLLRSFPFEWMVNLVSGGDAKKKAYGIIDFQK